MNVMLVGAHSQLGRCVQDRCPAHWDLTALGSAQLDIRDADAVSRVASAFKPDLIINAAAYNAVDRAELEPEQAFAVNAEGPGRLALAANRLGARLIHISTDYVFGGSGDSPAPHAEGDIAHPLNVYGRSKLQGEQAVLRIQPNALVIRTSWLYSEYGHNFAKTMMQSLRARCEVVDDQIGCPTYAGDLAGAIIQLAQRPDVSGGVYHYCGATALSWHDFAKRIAALAQLPGELVPIPSGRYPGAAQRPGNSTLSCEKIHAYGVQTKPLDASLARVIRKINLL